MTIFLIAAAAFAAEPRHFVPEILPPTALVAAIPAPPPYDETVAKWPLDGTTGKAPPLAALWFGTALLANHQLAINFPAKTVTLERATPER